MGQEWKRMGRGRGLVSGWILDFGVCNSGFIFKGEIVTYPRFGVAQSLKSQNWGM